MEEALELLSSLEAVLVAESVAESVASVDQDESSAEFHRCNTTTDFGRLVDCHNFADLSPDY